MLLSGVFATEVAFTLENYIFDNICATQLDLAALHRRARMSDNLKIRQPQDPKQVNVHEPWEVKYWTQKFGVTPSQLKQAVKEVGTQVQSVKRHLGK